MTRDRLEPFFIESPVGRIFLLLRAPEKAQHCVLFVPPFAEEMNKSRRQFTETTRLLVERGYAVLLVDPLGTGDSEGDFADATWDCWKADIAAAMDWVGENSLVLDAVVATRLGCALAAESLLATDRRVARSVFWQPVESGHQFMTQFLRLRVAASMMEAGQKETVEGLRQRLQAGETLEVAGYPLSPMLWRAIEAVDLGSLMETHLGRLAQFEVGRMREGELSPSGKRLAATAKERGIDVASQRIPGDPFWSATEMVVNVELAKRTVSFLTDELAA